MSLLDAFSAPEPEDSLSLAEEAALHAPAPYKPPHAEPEGISPLPEDFPVIDPLPRRENTERIMESLRERAVCRRKSCSLDDRESLAREAAEMSVDAIGELQGVAVALYAHGETLVAELLVDALVGIAEDILKPFLDSAGVDSEVAEDDE